MDKSTKKLVVQQIEVYLTKYPTATVKDIKKFIFSGSQAAVNIDTVKPNTLTQFIHYQMDKFNNMGSCLKRISGSGRPPTDKKVVSKVVKAFKTKVTPGQRSVAKKLRCTSQTIRRYLELVILSHYVI